MVAPGSLFSEKTLLIANLICVTWGTCWHVTADESLDFDVDQLIASEKAWATELDPLAISARNIRVTLTGIGSDKGLVHILAYDNEMSFAMGDHTNAVGYIQAAASRGTQTLMLDVLSSNKLALFAYHDENADEVLNKRGRVPEERYGFSGGINPLMQPSFEEASFTDDAITIRLVSIPRR